MRQMTCFFCPSCPEQPAFCRIRECFVKYHAVMGFSFLPPAVLNTGIPASSFQLLSSAGQSASSDASGANAKTFLSSAMQ